MSSPAIDRVRKLLELSKHAGSEAEAATAAQRAADLMAKYDLDEAAIAVETGATRVAEPIETHALKIDEKARHNRVAWRGSIANAVAKSYGCRMYWTGGTVKIFGRTSACLASIYTIQYLWNEVETLTEAAWVKTGFPPNKARTKAWKNACRIGAAQVIAVRLLEDSHEKTTAIKAAQACMTTDSTESQALMIIDREAEEVEEGYQKIAKGFTRASSIGRVSRTDGYHAGAAAGHAVTLDGSQHARLPKGTEVIPR